MKNCVLFLLTTLLISSISFGQREKSSRRLTAYLQTKQFVAPEIGNYIEIQFQYVGHSITYKTVDSINLVGELAVMIDVFQDGKIVANDGYRLETPVMLDGIVEDFYDIKRFALTPGEYLCNIEILDLNSTQSSVKTSFSFEVEEFTESISISDMIIAEAASPTNEMTDFFRSGYHILPRISNFYPSELNTLPVYFEVYNTPLLEDTTFSILQEIIDSERGIIISEYTKTSHHKSEVVVPVFKKIDLSNLPTGKYQLKMTLIDANSIQLSSQSYDFERSNDIDIVINLSDMILDPHFQLSIHDDSVAYYLASLIPISNSGQARTILKELKAKDKEKSRLMIQAFWKQTDPVNMYEAWMRYKQQVQYVEKAFKNVHLAGFETDRGRVYLQYGAPDRTIEREMSASEYPYEMWEYNKIGIYSNKKFIFYNPDLITNNYVLLHSNMLGELNNPRWQYEINRRNSARGNVDDPNEFNSNSWGNNARQILGN